MNCSCDTDDTAPDYSLYTKNQVSFVLHIENYPTAVSSVSVHGVIHSFHVECDE